MATVEITNLTKFQQVLNLPAHIVPEVSTPSVVGTTTVETTVVRDGKRITRGGEKKVHARRVRLGGSVTLQPKGEKEDTERGLPLSVQQAPDIIAALAARPARIKLKIVDAPTEDDVKAVLAQEDASKKAADTAKAHADARRKKRDKQAGADVGDEEKGSSNGQ